VSPSEFVTSRIIADPAFAVLVGDEKHHIERFTDQAAHRRCCAFVNEAFKSIERSTRAIRVDCANPAAG
jgi:hypothetical protein